MAPWPARSDSHRRRPSGRDSPPPPPPTGPPPPPPALIAQGRSPVRPTTARKQSHDNAASRYALQTSRLSRLEVLDGSELYVSSSSEDEHLKPPRPSRPQHGRSLSNPFPSLFTSKKKKPARGSSDDSESDSLDDLAQMANSKSKPQQAHRTANNGQSSAKKDFATGQCMTCGSLVRWPRELHVFRCTICLTINDLQPPQQDGARGEQALRDRSAGEEGAGIPTQQSSASSAVSPISVEATSRLIQQCLQEYLQRALAARAQGQLAREGGSRISSSSPDAVHSATASSDAPMLFSSPQESTQLPTRSAQRNPQMRSSNPARHPGSSQRSYSTSYPDKRPTLRDVSPDNMALGAEQSVCVDELETKKIFGRLDDYIISKLTSFEPLNTSFLADRSGLHLQPQRERVGRRTSDTQREPGTGNGGSSDHLLTDMDAKMLMVGDFAENGLWWTGGQEEQVPARAASHRTSHGPSLVTQRTPRLDWDELDEWYSTVLNPSKLWPTVYDELVRHDGSLAATESRLREIDSFIHRAQEYTQRNILKATESILKRPGRPIGRPSDLRFILVLLANPLLYASHKPILGRDGDFDPGSGRVAEKASRASGPASGQHSGVIKRIVGLLSNAPNDCHTHIISWFARYPETRFAELKELVGGFLVYRLLRQHDKKQDVKVDLVEGLIPNMSAGRTAASLHAALGNSARQSKKSKEAPKKQLYSDDWQIRAAAQVMGLIFAANNTTHSRRRPLPSQPASQNSGYASTFRDTAHTRGQVFPTSDFYVTLLDDSDLVSDFEAWEHKRGRFSFCQYPFLLSIGAKIQIMEYDARRQMQTKARDAFFDSLVSRRAVEQYLTLDVRRDCLVEDSLSAVSEVIGSGSEDVKKALRIIFRGEEGIDAGGLRKEWFLLLIREVFNPEHGMFVYDEDSQHCYFNPNSFETSDQYFLVGVVFGLAIYNSTILDVAFPPFAFRKLLMAAPVTAATSPPQQQHQQQQPRPAMTYTLDDLAQYRPRLARGFRQLLDYDGDDVESVFCLDFVAVVEKYGAMEQVPLCAGGERRPVTKANRREYVDLYVRYLLDTAVARQFEPFKRGFFTVCGGNALSLFRPEEIELLVRGSDEALDIASLRAVATYDNWASKDAARTEPTVRWFWETFAAASPQDQRKLLLFVTGSDRIPAMGAASLSIRIACLGEDTGRYPTARTCFNSLSLYRYRDRGRLERLLWTAVRESEGFGLK